MPKHVSQKANTVYRNAKGKEASYRIGDGGGLFLLVDPDGSKRWRGQYARSVTGRRNTLSLGDYPTLTVAQARLRRDDALRLLAEGIDPGEYRKNVKTAGIEAAANTFKALCLEWLSSRDGVIEPAQIAKSKARLLKDVIPWLGDKPIHAITAPDVLAVMRRIDERGAHYTAHKVKQEISMIMRYAIATARAERDPCPDLERRAPSTQGTTPCVHNPAQGSGRTAPRHGWLCRQPPRKVCPPTPPLLFVRPGELRQADLGHFPE